MSWHTYSSVCTFQIETLCCGTYNQHHINAFYGLREQQRHTFAFQKSFEFSSFNFRNGQIYILMAKYILKKQPAKSAGEIMEPSSDNSMKQDLERQSILYPNHSTPTPVCALSL